MVKLLVVDDEEDIRLLIKTLLEGEGYEVEDAKDGFDGLDKLRKNKYDLVVIDFFMPGMSGRELLEKMRQSPEAKDTKAVFLTVANFSLSGREELKKLGCLDYIQKPVDNDDFLARVKKALKG